MDSSKEPGKRRSVRSATGYLLLVIGVILILGGLVAYCVGACAYGNPAEVVILNPDAFAYGSLAMILGCVVVVVGRRVLPKDKR